MSPDGPDVIAYASMLSLSHYDIKVLAVKDPYSLHKVVFGLFDDVRSESEKRKSTSSGILYADKGGDFKSRKILILSDRKPHQTPQFGKVETKYVSTAFLTCDRYAFEVTLNPGRRCQQTGKIIPVIGKENIQLWFSKRAPISWGFDIAPETLQIERSTVQSFEKSGHRITHSSATLKGDLVVTDRKRFSESFLKGVGRGRAFGFGLLQIVPESPQVRNPVRSL